MSLSIWTHLLGALVLTVGSSSERQASPAAAVGSLQLSYSTDAPREIKRPSLTSLKRGTGGRSSFSGMVATVFGCTGLLGRPLCHRLGKIGTQLILPYRGDNYSVGSLKLVGDLGQVLFHPFELNSDESIRKAVKYSNVVINLIGRDWETKNFSYSDVHVNFPRRLARICREMGVEKFVHVSALNADPHPEPLILKEGSQLLRHKWLGEQVVQEEFPDAIIFKPSVIYGSQDKFIRYYVTSWRRTFFGTPMWKKGEHTIKQPVYVGDVAQGIVNALRDPDAVGKTFQAIGPERYRLADLVNWIYAIMRRDDDPAFTIYDMKYNPAYLLQVKIQNMLSLATPYGYVHPESLETEHTTDRVVPEIPTLEDLGVEFTEIEGLVTWELRPFRAFNYYEEEVGEFETPLKPAPVI